MDSIKKFFEKKKSDTKFKVAGQGKKLTAQAHGSGHSRQGRSLPFVSSPPTAGAVRAGSAALARAQANQKQEVNWSVQAIKARARKEMEAEKKLEIERQAYEDQFRLNEVEDNRHEGEAQSRLVDGSSMLAVQGVYFYCSLLGSDVATYEEIKERIKQFLYSQLGEDKAVASCIIIHTCNKNKEKVKFCIETLCKYIQNIVENPTEVKYHKIRTTNNAYQQRIQPIVGTQQFFEAAGFIMQELEHNEEQHKFWVFPEDKLSELSLLEQVRDSLVSAEPLRPQLSRSIQVLLPTEASKHRELPPEFYTLTADELRKEMQLRTEGVQRSMMLRTKAMRDRDGTREMRKYRFSLIRVRFPDGLILQGTFGINEKYGAVVEFVRENLSYSWRPFFLGISGEGKITEEDETLAELRLAPAIVFNFEWDLSIQDPNLDDNIFIKQETLELLEPVDN